MIAKFIRFIMIQFSPYYVKILHLFSSKNIYIYIDKLFPREKNWKYLYNQIFYKVYEYCIQLEDVFQDFLARFKQHFINLATEKKSPKNKL